jgi:N-[(2S)-2-amino-2-carboxyethyl]-L-glutamate dehydrogenase
MDFEFSIVTGKTIHGLLQGRLTECVEVVKQAYLTHGRKQAINPNSYFLKFPEKPSCRIIALPAYLGGAFNVSGIKWIASYPENITRGFPRASAVLVLNSYETGYPFACLESSIISAARTAASAVLGAEHMNGGERHVKTLGIVGNGFIAKYIYTFLLGMGWEIEALKLFDVSSTEAEKFKEGVCDPARHKEISVAPSLNDLLRSSELIVLTTVAAAPHIVDFDLLRHNPVVLHISLRDITPEILLRSHNIVDDVEHVMQAGTSCHLAERATGGRGFVTGTLAELMEGACSVDRSRPTLFSPFGLGILDLAVGKWLYDLAVESGQSIRVSDFFHEVTR